MAQRYGRRNGGRGYEDRNSAPRGPDHRVLIGIVVGGSVVVLVLIILLLSRGRGSQEPDYRPIAAKQPGSPAPAPTSSYREVKAPPKPLNQAEKDRIHSLVKRLDARTAEVRRLVKQGFEAQDAGDLDRAQECWRAADDILAPMIEESEKLFNEIGDDRVSTYAAQDYETTGEWGPIHAEYFKYLKPE
jgi:hypothetical protein